MATKEVYYMDNRVRTGLRIPYKQNTELILIAKELGMSKNALILQILRDWIENYENKSA